MSAVPLEVILRFGSGANRAVRAMLLVCVAAAPQFCEAAPILVNGGFETGDFTGWTVVVQSGGNGNFFVTSANTSPIGAYPTPGPHSGTYYAVSDQAGPSAEALLQSFTVPAGTPLALNFQMFVNTYAPVAVGGGLDYTSAGTNAPNQYARVDLLTGSASAFDTGGGVLATFYLGADPMTDGSTSNPYTSYSFNLTPYVSGGGTFQIRFADVANQGTLNLGVDDVSIGPLVPEPSAGILASLGLLALAGRRAWRNNRTSGRNQNSSHNQIPN